MVTRDQNLTLIFKICVRKIEVQSPGKPFVVVEGCIMVSLFTFATMGPSVTAGHGLTFYFCHQEGMVDHRGPMVTRLARTKLKPSSVVVVEERRTLRTRPARTEGP